MTAQAFYDAARAYKREATGNAAVGLTQAEVDAFRVIVGAWEKARATALADPAAFFGAVRSSFGSLSQAQVEGFNRLLAAMGAAGWPVAFTAYGLVTSWHETAYNLKPVEEAYWKDDGWRRRNLRYYPWHGRGDVQLTWEQNYRRADEELGLGGRLIADPSLALDPEISARVLVRGMEQGWFTGKRLSHYLPSSGTANAAQFTEARRIINGTDKAQAIAGKAMKMQAALVAGGWA